MNLPEHQNTDLLEEVRRAAAMGLEAVQVIEPKIRDEALLQEVRRQGAEYRRLSSRAEQMLRRQGRRPSAEEPVKKAMLRGSVHWNTLMDSSTGRLSELLINGTTMGIIDMTKKLNDHPEADAGARQLAGEYLKSEELHIEKLKKLL